jgi:predicted SnoaL-like aldol condensation-catalyzing enzyme
MADSETDTNRGVITEFARLMYVERDPGAALARYASTEYTQHNAMLPDGRDAAASFLTTLYSDPNSLFEVQRILVDGPLAALHVRAHPAGRPLLAVADFYRLADGLIVEHWDVIQEVPSSSANAHPMF